MKISKKLVATLITLGVAGMGVMTHAAPPVGKIVLQTYSCKRVNNCYTGIGTGKTGWIAAHDDLIRLYEIRSDGWVKGDYPAGSGRVTRWFKFGDLVMNGNFKNYEANLVNVKTLPVYRTYNSGSSFGTVYNTDKVMVVDEYGSRKCIVYNLDAGGYKMGWVDKNKVAGVTSRATNTTISNSMVNTSSGVRKQSTTKISTIYRGSDIAVKIYQVMGSKYGSRWTGAEQCWGFAHQLYRDLFGQECSLGSLKESSNNIDLNYSGNVRKVGSVYNRNVDAIKNLFMQAKVGYYVQLARNADNSNHTAGSPHSAIISSIGDGGVSFYEANVDWHNGIGDNWYSWKDLAVNNRGLAIYAPKDY